MGFVFGPCCVMHYLVFFFSSFTIILARKRELIASWCLVAVGVLWRFHTVPRGGLQYVIVVSPDHTHLFLTILTKMSARNAVEMSSGLEIRVRHKINVSKHMTGAQWLSGRVLDSRPRGLGFEPHRRHCVVVLEQDTFILA